ncbi:DUF3954 domain-containing protein [Evansella clarkii]|uniref:DUF3954 domain-containing protein n=1 Tax=Evansella clarkii TaxID=79879 RepID=UPI001472D08A|nr:DUF3954 domain-containing protein [Evansella clarkii]
MEQKKRIVEIDITENCIYVVKNGTLTKIKCPDSGHGDYTVTWKDHRMMDVVKKERIRI